MQEVVMIRNSSHIDPILHIWGWEIPVYLFLGGLTAGLMILVSIFALRNGKSSDPMSRWVRWSTFVAPAVLSLGMFALMLDLSYKPHIFRFYTAFRLGSPMSWGSWILVGIYPVTLLLGLVYLTVDETKWLAQFKPLRMFGLGKLITWLQEKISPYKKHMLWANLAMGIGLGVYTGILLSALGTARPVWNSAILGPLFLVSGFSTGAALMMLLPIGHEEHGVLRKLDMWAIGVELALLVLFLITLASAGAQPERNAAGLFFGGRFTATFWSLVVIAGLLVPLSLEWIESKTGHKPTIVAPVLLLIGGLSLRWILVAAGQV